MSGKGILATFLVILAVMTVMCGEAFAQSSQVKPGFIFLPSFSIKQETGFSGGNQTVYMFDFRGGYRVSNGLYFGALMTRNVSSGDYSGRVSAFGNSVGYYYGSFSLTASMIITASKDESSSAGTTVRSEGSGFQFDLAWNTEIQDWIFFTPILTFRSISYSKEQVGSDGSESRGHVETSVYPYFGLMMLF